MALLRSAWLDNWRVKKLLEVVTPHRSFICFFVPEQLLMLEWNFLTKKFQIFCPDVFWNFHRNGWKIVSTPPRLEISQLVILKVASTPFFAFWSKVWNKIWLLTSDSLKAFGQSSKINEFYLVGRNMPSVNSRCAFHTPNFHSIIGFCVSVVDLTFLLTNTLL